MPIDPRAKEIGEAITLDLDLSQLDLSVVRAATDLQARNGPRPPVAAVQDRIIDGPDGELPLRIYTPEGAPPRAALVYFHGGGWVFCSVETHDATCRDLANRAGCIVVSVEYRLAPEHKFPAAAEDAYAATCWVAEDSAGLGVDASRVAVAGDSAGGNLAAVVALMARDRGGPALRHQLLVYPITDFSFETDSYREHAGGPVLTRRMMETFWRYYLEDASQGTAPYASPLRAESLEGLPPAHVITAEFDPLCDEGEAYAGRLVEADVAVDHKRYGGMVHGFFAMTDELPAAREAMADAARLLRTALG